MVYVRSLDYWLRLLYTTRCCESLLWHSWVLFDFENKSYPNHNSYYPSFFKDFFVIFLVSRFFYEFSNMDITSYFCFRYKFIFFESKLHIDISFIVITISFRSFQILVVKHLYCLIPRKGLPRSPFFRNRNDFLYIFDVP